MASRVGSALARADNSAAADFIDPSSAMLVATVSYFSISLISKKSFTRRSWFCLRSSLESDAAAVAFSLLLSALGSALVSTLVSVLVSTLVSTVFCVSAAGASFFGAGASSFFWVSGSGLAVSFFSPALAGSAFGVLAASVSTFASVFGVCWAWLSFPGPAAGFAFLVLSRAYSLALSEM